ncbi:MAG: SprB repeat-containing protein, partial [Spirochaetota bacterium]
METDEDFFNTGRVPATSLPDYESKSINSIFFLEKPDLTIEPEQPDCHEGDNASVVIDNIPFAETSAGLRIDFIELLYDSNTNANEYEDSGFGWGGQVTDSFSIDPGQTSLELNKDSFDGNFNFTKGPYAVKAYYDTSLCSSDTVFEINAPDPLSLTIEPKTIDISDIYHTSKPGGTGSVKLTARGGRDSAKYEYWTSSNDDRVLFNKISKLDSVISIDSLSNNDSIFLSNTDSCEDTFDVVKFISPDPLQIEIDSANPPTCSSEDEGNSENGSITFSISGGISSYTITLYVKGDNGEYTPATDIDPPVSDNWDGLPEGIYMLKVSDRGGQTTDSSEINLIQAPIGATLADASPKLDCYEDEYTVEIDNTEDGYSFGYKNSSSSAYTPFTNNNLTLGGGDYDIQITEGDCYHVHDLSVKEPDEITIENINSSEATCSLQNGSLSFDVSGGWTDRNYVVTLRGTEIQGAMSDTIGVGEDKKVTFPDLPAGTDYAVEVTNGGKCSTLEENITVDKSNPLDAINISQTKDASCHAVHDATLKINNPDIIEGNFTIEIDRQEYSPNSNNEITGLAANKSAFFEIYETEGRECNHGEDIEIKIREDSLNFRSEIQIDSTSCGSASNGSISIGGMNGQGDYKYEMNNEGFTEAFSSQPHIFDGLANGIYFVSIRDEVGCVVSDSFTVESRSIYPISLSDEDIFVDSATCMTSEDGEIKLENIIHRDDLDLTVEYDDISKTIHTGGGVSYPKIGPGTYLFTIKDENGCSLKRDIDLGHNDINPVITNTRVLEEVACPGKTNGRFSIEMDRSDVFNYALYANEVSPTNVVSSDTVNEKSVFDIEGITNNPRYILEVEDPLGCYVSDTLEMPLLENPVSLSQVQTPASCDEINNGVLFLTADGGFPENNRYVFHYDKQPRSGEAFQRDSLTEKLTIEGLSAGDYFEVSVQDKYGCKDEGDPLSIPLKENYTRIENVFPTHPACKGDSTGMLSTQMQWTPGTTDYEHWLMTLDEDFDVSDTLSQGAFHLDNLDFEELGAGRYELHVLDADGCSDNMSVELVDPDPVVVDVRHNYIRAKGDSTGQIGLSMHGGNQKYEVGWAALPEGDAWSDTDTFTESLFEVGGLKAGDYRVVVRDTANCPYFDGETWFSRDVSIIEPDEALNIETHEVTDASCNKYSDGRIEVMGSGGWGPDYRYSLNGGEWQPTGRFNGLTAGEYNVVVTDTAGVQFNLPLVVNEPDTLNLFVDSTRYATCPLYADGRVEATAINGIPGNDGLHYFIKDVDDRSLVYGDQHGGRDYQFYQLPKGDYELFVTDAHDCLASKPFRINEPDTAQIHIDHNFVRARGESTGRISALVEKGNGMFDYRWFINNNPYAFHADTTSGPIALDELDAGRYTLMVRDTAGCVYEESEWMVRRINIREPDTVLHFNIDENRAVSCFGDHDGRLRMKPAGGWGDYRYRLDDGAFVASPVFDSLSPGEYQLSVQDSAGIVYSAPATVSEPDPLQASLKGSRDVNCHGGADGAIMLEAEGGNLSYLVSHNGESWQKGTTIEGLPKGTFVPHVKDTLDCSLRLDSVEIKQPSRIRLVDSTIVKSRCSNNEGSIAASFEGGIGTFSYQWYKDTLDAGGDRQMVKLPGKRANEATRLFSGRYKAYVTDEHDCTVGFEFFVGDITDLSIDAIDTRDVWCWGNSDGEAEASVIKGNPPYEYTWTEEIGVAANAMAREIPAGKHGLMVTDAKGCKDYRDFIIGTPDSLFYDTLSFEDPLCLGGRKGHLEVAGTGGTPGYQYQWDNGVAGPEQVNLAPGTYTLTLTDAHDCRAEFDFGM